MLDNQVDNPKSPKYYVKRYLEEIHSWLRDKTVIDMPAGNGVTSELLLQHGANVEAFDLFPEYFMLKEISCRRADIQDHIPVEGKYADMVICQEGIEHFSDQANAFKEFSRILKKGGRLLITTPSYSNLSARISYLLFESETNKKMPPNEIDDIWMSDKTITTELYHGHIFLVGLQKLRILAKLAGFRIMEIRYLRLSKSSLLLLPLFYPAIFLSSWYRYFRNMKKHPEIPRASKKGVYSEQLKINISIKNLMNHHVFILFEKTIEPEEVYLRVESMVKPFDKIM